MTKNRMFPAKTGELESLKMFGEVGLGRGHGVVWYLGLILY